MKKNFDIEQIIQNGEIKSELELEKASIAERKLRTLAKEDKQLKHRRSQLRELIVNYEAKHWADQDIITEDQIIASDNAELEAAAKFEFIMARKKLIRSKLKRLGINQQEFGKILGHDNKSYMSELMNGISPFTLKDLVIIGRLLRIDLNKLVMTHINKQEKLRIEQKIKSLDNSNIRLDKETFEIV